LITTDKNAEVANCSAVLIGKKLLLTAAHCLDEVHGLTVRMGEKSIAVQPRFVIHPDYTPKPKFPSTSKGPQNNVAIQDSVNGLPLDHEGNLIFFQTSYEISKKYYSSKLGQKDRELLNFNSKVSPKQWADLALIFLEDEVPDEFSPIPLAEMDSLQNSKMGEELFSFGFGLSSLNVFGSDHSLRGTDLILVGYTGELERPQQLATFSPNRKGLMLGDSGGPVVIKKGEAYYLIGINSSIGSDGHALATLPSSYKDWILSTGELN
jgi:hypothetical protein